MATRALIAAHDLRDSTSEVLERVSVSPDPLVVTRNGRETAVLLGMAEFERREERAEILRRLALGELEIRQGAGYSIDEVMAGADALLESPID